MFSVSLNSVFHCTSYCSCILMSSFRPVSFLLIPAIRRSQLVSGVVYKWRHAGRGGRSRLVTTCDVGRGFGLCITSHVR